MGMHFGILAAAAPAQGLVHSLQQHVPGITLGARHGTLEEVHPDDDEDGWHLGIGEHEGASYLCDISSMISGDPDLVVEMSRLLQTRVVGCGAETGSGTFWLYVAQDGELQRGYWMCFSSVDVPWQSGTPLPDELFEGITERFGHGLMDALRYLGFDYEAWANRPDLGDLVWRESALAQGPLAQEIETYWRGFSQPKDKKKPRFGFLGR